MPKTKAKAWSVAGERILEKIKPNTPPAIADQIREEANRVSLVHVYGENFEVDANGNPQEQGIGSLKWLLSVDEAQAERHFNAIERYVGPAAARAEREKIARLKGRK